MSASAISLVMINYFYGKKYFLIYSQLNTFEREHLVLLSSLFYLTEYIQDVNSPNYLLLFYHLKKSFVL